MTRFSSRAFLLNLSLGQTECCSGSRCLARRSGRHAAAEIDGDKRTPIGGCIFSDGSWSVSPTRWSASATTKEGATRAIVSTTALKVRLTVPPETDGCGRLPPRTRQCFPSCFSAERCMMKTDGRNRPLGWPDPESDHSTMKGYASWAFLPSKQVWTDGRLVAHLPTALLALDEWRTCGCSYQPRLYQRPSARAGNRKRVFSHSCDRLQEIE